jgi:hypothetical protein
MGLGGQCNVQPASQAESDARLNVRQDPIVRQILGTVAWHEEGQRQEGPENHPHMACGYLFEGLLGPPWS